MKRLFAALLAVLFLFCLLGCQKESVPAATTVTNTPSAATEPTEGTVTTEPETTVPPDGDPLPPDNYEDPPAITTGNVWIANCDDSINFRATPGGDLICAIPKGGEMELISWNDKYAKVRYNGAVGYVGANYIMPKDDHYFAKHLDVVAPTNVYTYEQMNADLSALKEQYPGIVTLSSIGNSTDGRAIPLLLIGNTNAQHHVLLQGAIHGREHMTAWLIMATAEYWLDHNILSYGDVCYHIIPMVNPDGVTISQTQQLNEYQQSLYQNDKAKGYAQESGDAYAAAWKANSIGIDLNRNFPCGWEPINDRPEPSYQGFKGTEPFTAAESIALRDYTLAHKFDATVSYHSSGSIIYFEYGKKQPVNAESRALADAVSAVNKYTLINSTGVNGGGYKDWVMDELGIPSITIEIGSGDSPLQYRELYNVFDRNYGILPAIAQWLQS